LRWWYGESLATLADRVKRTMPADNPGGLDDLSYVNVLAYMLQENGYQPGQVPLGVDPNLLELLVIEPSQGQN